MFDGAAAPVYAGFVALIAMAAGGLEFMVG